MDCKQTPFQRQTPNPKTMKYLDVPSSGSIADRTHSHNRAGQYTRNRRAPVQPIGTGRRAFIRSAFGNASAAWATLTNAQQEAWISFAADHPITDALGQAVVLTGHQMYVALTTNLVNVGLAPLTDPPTTLVTPDLSAISATFGVAAGLEVDAIGGAAGDFVAVSVSKPLGTGRRFNKTFWQPLGADGYVDVAGGTYTLTTAKYSAEFGTLTAGKVVFVRVIGINARGWAGTPTILRVVTAA